MNHNSMRFCLVRLLSDKPDWLKSIPFCRSNINQTRSKGMFDMKTGFELFVLMSTGIKAITDHVSNIFFPSRVKIKKLASKDAKPIIKRESFIIFTKFQVYQVNDKRNVREKENF